MRRLRFTGPLEVAVEERPVPDPGPEEVVVEAAFSAISAGTEGLIYRGEAPTELPADESLPALEGDLSFPLSYGYAAAGRVAAAGTEVDEEWVGRRVFGYTPHASQFLARPGDLLEVPPGIPLREAALFANVETAVALVLDGEPLVGERVAVVGQGVVGLLTTALLGRLDLASLIAFDEHERRRAASEAQGAGRALSPEAGIADGFQDRVDARADLVYELSGNPAALDSAIETASYDGRVIVGSWYGTKPATVELGGRFHRDRIELRSSQVSTIPPRHGGRWDHDRRREVAWRRLRALDLEGLLTHEFPIERAGEAYDLVTERPGEAIQVLFSYGNERS